MIPFAPIGTVYCVSKERYEVACQPGLQPNHSGYIELNAGSNFEQALSDLEGFDRIWVLFVFHHNHHWRPMVEPPRGGIKRGLFATRSPHRPNPIGLSCVELIRLQGRRLYIASHDLLDQTPILDIKPYIPTYDSYPNAKAGWFDELAPQEPHIVIWAPLAERQAKWIISNGGPDLPNMTESRLSLSPHPDPKKRIYSIGPNLYELACKTWRLQFEIKALEVHVLSVSSGYTESALNQAEDRWHDKELHKVFVTCGKSGGYTGNR